MLPSEVAKFLALASQYDSRNIDDNMVAGWAEMLNLYVPDLTEDEARMAVLAHYAGSSTWMMPNQFIELIRQRRSLVRDGKTIIGGPVHPKSDIGYRVVTETLARIKLAGGGAPHLGQTIGKAKCIEIAEQVIKELGARKGTERPGQHCGWTGCNCTHTEGCEAGWIEKVDGSGVVACSYCRPSAHHILASVATTMDAGRALRDPVRTTR